MTTPITARSQDDIVARIRQIQTSGEDFFGFRIDALCGLLDAEHVRPFLKEEADLTLWPEPQPVEEQGREYLEFAFGKALDHRGLSADRSVQKLAEYAWALGRDDVAEQMGRDENYPQYGAPALVIFAKAFGWPVPDDPDLARMAQGEPCEPGCQDGCAR